MIGAASRSFAAIGLTALAVFVSACPHTPPRTSAPDADSLDMDAATGDGGHLLASDAGNDAGLADAGADGGVATGLDGGTLLPVCDAGMLSADDRVITVVSECADQTVVLGVNGSFVQDCAGDGSCPMGTTCLASRNPPGCFWDFPPPACGSSILNRGDSVTYVLSAPSLNNVKWSGNLYAQSHCSGDGGGCATGVCSSSENGVTSLGACASGVGPQGPVTLAEMTLSSTGVDFYDISIINGVNVPMELSPAGGESDPLNPYTCQAAGSHSASSTGLAACSWGFDPTIALNGSMTDESLLLRAVTPGGTACSSDADCSNSEVCGSALAFGTTSVPQTCGTQVGWWTADELCAFTANAMGAPVSCSSAVSGQGTEVDLYQCIGANADSCYSAGAESATCCGCPHWVVDGEQLPVPPGFTCHDTNASWQSVAEPWAAFLKNACPTAYSFPFDDATSTFTCSTPNPGAQRPNSMGYVLTLCPGGISGI